MQGPIYKFFRVRWTEAYYQLNPEERQALFTKIENISKEQGVKTLALCNSNWSNERWDGFGVEEFSDMEALVKHNAALAAAEWFRYIDAETMLGTAFPQDA
jgi:hypothetical protein